MNDPETTVRDVLAQSKQLVDTMRNWIRWFDDRHTGDRLIIGLTSDAIDAIETLIHHIQQGDTQS